MQENLNAALYKIRSILNVSEKEFIEKIDNHIEVFSSSPIQKSDIPEKVMDTILKGIDKKLALDLTYNSFSKNENTSRIVEPIGICHYSFNWHLIAYCDLRKDFRDFRIDRIKSIKLSNKNFSTDNKPSIREYFKTMTSDSDVFLVKLQFSKDVIPEISQSKYYFGFIDEKEIKGKVEMSFLSNSEDYIGRWIITLADKVEILEPDTLKASVVGLVKDLQKKYLPS